MRDLLNPYDVRRYLNLWTIAAFETDGGGGGGGSDDGGSASGQSANGGSFNMDDPSSWSTPSSSDDYFASVNQGSNWSDGPTSHPTDDDPAWSSSDETGYSWSGSDAYNTVDDGGGGQSNSLVTGTASDSSYFNSVNQGSNWNDDGSNTGGVPDSSDSSYNTSTSDETNVAPATNTSTSTSTSTYTPTYTYTPPPVYTPPAPTYYYDKEGGRHTSNAARNAANAAIQRAEDRREALEYVQSRYNTEAQDAYGFVSPAYASTNNQPVYGMNTGQDSRYSIDARQALGPELGYGTPASIAAERTLNNISNPEEMFPDEAYDALMDDEDFSVDYSIDDLLPPLPALDPPEDDKPSTSRVDYTGNIYSQDSPYYDDLKAKQGTVDPNFDYTESAFKDVTTTDDEFGRLLASGATQVAENTGVLLSRQGERVTPTSARAGYEVGQVDPALIRATYGEDYRSVPTNLEPSALTEYGKQLTDIAGNLGDRVRGGLSAETQKELVTPIYSTDPKDNKYGRPGINVDTGALGTQLQQGMTSAALGLGTSYAGLAARGAVMSGGEIGREARMQAEAEARAQGFPEEIVEAYGTEAEKMAVDDGMALGAISNTLFGKIVPNSGSIGRQVARNTGEEAVTEGYLEQQPSAYATDLLLDTDRFGKAVNVDEGTIAGILSGGATLATAPAVNRTTPAQPEAPVAGSLGTAPKLPSGTSPDAQTGIGSLNVTENKDLPPSAPSAETTPDKFTVAEQLMMQQLEDQGALDVTEFDGLGLTLNETEEVANRVMDKKLDQDYQMLRALAEEEVIQTGGLSEEMNQEIRDKLPEDMANEVINTAITKPFVNNQGQSRMDQMLQMEQDKAATPPAIDTPFTPTGIETALGAAPNQESKPSINEEQQLELLLDEGQEQQLDLMDQKEDSGTTIVVEDNATTDPNTTVTPTTDPNTTVTPTTDPNTTVTPSTTVTPTTDTSTTVGTTVVDVDDMEDPEEPEVDVEVEDDDTVRPITTVTDDGRTITECPEGYRMVEGTDGPYCVVDLTQSYTRQRAGRGIEAYTGIATKGQKGPGQKKKTVTKTTQKRRPVVTRQV